MTWVRFLPPQLVEVTRLDEGPVLKTGAVKTVVGSSPTASALHEGLMVQQEDARVACQPFFYLDRAGASPGESTFNLIPWSSGNDSWLTTRKRWFESIRDYWDC